MEVTATGPTESLMLPVYDRSQAGAARRTAAKWGQVRGWTEDMAGRVALIITELGNNLALHTKGGVLLVRSLSHGAASGVEILALDSAPGMANFNECLRDGYSTAGTPGTGLGAVKRTSDLFTIHSQPDVGTAILSEVWAKEPDFRAGRKWHCGVASVAKPGDTICGDSWVEYHVRPEMVRLMIADGLGHGEFAAEASLKAVETLLKFPALEIPALFERMHEALRATRGAAISIADLDLAAGSVTYAGLGNVSATIISHDATTSLVSMNGTVGIQFRPAKIFTYPWPAGATLVMMSDGLKSQWNVSRYAGLLERHPSLIAGILYRDYVRGSDDATVLVARSLP